MTQRPCQDQLLKHSGPGAALYPEIKQRFYRARTKQKPEFSVLGDHPQMKRRSLLLLRPTQRRPLDDLHVTLKLVAELSRPPAPAAQDRMLPRCCAWTAWRRHSRS